MKRNLFILLVSILIISCYDDKSKSALFPDSPIKINYSNTYSTFVGEVCDVFIPVNWNGEDSLNYHFQWKSVSGEVLSEDRNFEKMFTEVAKVPVTFEVINNSTGLITAHTIIISVTSPYNKGWLILGERNNETTLHFIHGETYRAYPDVYSLLYPEDRLGINPYRIEEILPFNMIENEIKILQDETSGSIVLNGEDFSKSHFLKEEFIYGEYPYENFEVKNSIITMGGKTDLLLSNQGEIYTRDLESLNSRYSTIPLVYPDSKGTRFTRIHRSKMMPFTLLFDELNKRWLPHGVADTYYPPMINLLGSTFDFCNGMDDNIELVYSEMANELFVLSDLVNILKDKNTDTYYYQNSSLMYDMINQVSVMVTREETFAQGYEIDDDTQFCLTRDGEKYLFFNVGNKLYFHRASSSLNPIYLFKDFDIVEDAPTGKVVSIHIGYTGNELGISFSDGHFFILDISTGIMENIAFGEIDPLQPDWINKIEVQHYKELGTIVHSITKYGDLETYVGL